jgi:HAD superfamily hydrolase (TIGR01509 family)
VHKLGGNVPPSFYQFHMGNSHAVVRAAFMAEAGLNCDPNEYTRIYHETYRHLLETSLVVTPGAHALLQQLTDRGFALAVVSSSRAWMMNQVLDQTKLAGFFHGCVSAEDVTRPKPAPDAYLLALERLGIGSAAAVAVEDSAPGVEAALSAGVTVLAVRHAFNHTHDFSKAAAVFESLDDTAEILSVIDSLIVPAHA